MYEPKEGDGWMKVQIFSGKVYALLVCLFAAGFFAGFDYAVVTSRNNSLQEAKKTEIRMELQEKTGLTDVPIKDIMISTGHW